ncbi:hypothetical protein PVIIG_00271 [Plasmodium vivax India VII]|uniref:Uncharacterized protein n=1 Tax=Plasmodium vivax India VII TaxID=1077284 RepID=A0A0J9S847_PLAVI|nr:hypothetical protein PVIIG_00271 [Plasmodium vivax India VII]
MLNLWVFLWKHKQLTHVRVTASQLNQELLQRRSPVSKKIARQIVRERILLNEHIYKSKKLMADLQKICGGKKQGTLEDATSLGRHTSYRDEIMRVILLGLYRSLRIDRHGRSFCRGENPQGAFINGGGGSNFSSYDILDHLEDPTLSEFCNFPIKRCFTGGGKAPPAGEAAEKNRSTHLKSGKDEIQPTGERHPHETTTQSESPPNLILHKGEVYHNDYGKTLFDVFTERNKEKKLFDLCGDLRLLDNLTWPLYLKKCLFMLLYVMKHSFLLQRGEEEEWENTSNEYISKERTPPSRHSRGSSQGNSFPPGSDDSNSEKSVERGTIPGCCGDLQNVQMRRYTLSWVPNRGSNSACKTTCRGDMLAILDFLCGAKHSFEMLGTNEQIKLLSFFLNAIRCGTVQGGGSNGEGDHSAGVNPLAVLETHMGGASNGAANWVPSNVVPSNGVPRNGKTDVDNDRGGMKNHRSTEERSYVERVGEHFDVKVHLLGEDRHGSRYYVWGEPLGCSDCIYVELVNERGPLHTTLPYGLQNRMEDPPKKGHTTSAPKGRTQIGYIEGVGNISRFVELFSPSSVEEAELKRRLVQLREALVSAPQVQQVQQVHQVGHPFEENSTSGNPLMGEKKTNCSRDASRGGNQSADEEGKPPTNIQCVYCKNCQEVGKQMRKKAATKWGDQQPLLNTHMGGNHTGVRTNKWAKYRKKQKGVAWNCEEILFDQMICLIEKLLYFIKKTKMVLNESAQEKMGKLVDTFIVLSLKVVVKKIVTKNIISICEDFLYLMENTQKFFSEHSYCFLLKKRWRRDLKDLWQNDVRSLKKQFSEPLKCVNVLDILPTLCFYFTFFVTHGLKEKAIHLYRKYGLTGMASELEDSFGRDVARRKLQSLKKFRALLREYSEITFSGMGEEFKRRSRIYRRYYPPNEGINDVLSDVYNLLPYKVHERYIYFKEGHLKHMEMLLNNCVFFSERNDFQKIKGMEILDVRDIKIFIIPKGDIWKKGIGRARPPPVLSPGGAQEGMASGVPNGVQDENPIDPPNGKLADQTKEDGLPEKAHTASPLTAKGELSEEAPGPARHHTHYGADHRIDFHTVREDLFKIKEAVERNKWGPPNKHDALYFRPLEEYSHIFEAQLSSSFLSPNFVILSDVKNQLKREEAPVGKSTSKGTSSVHGDNTEETFVYVCQLHCVTYAPEYLGEDYEEYFFPIEEEPFFRCERYVEAHWKFLTLNVCFTESRHSVFYIFPLGRSDDSFPWWGSTICSDDLVNQGTSNVEQYEPLNR